MSPAPFLPIGQIGEICAEEDILFVVDTAQTAGVLDIDFQKIGADALAFTGHKGLLAPQGIGGFLLSQKVAGEMETLVSGGTGSLSEYEEVPPYLPDKFEAGTPNLPGIYGLHRALQYLSEVGLDFIREKELKLAGYLLEELGEIEGVTIAGPKGTEGRMAVVSADFVGYDNAQVAYWLDKRFGIRTRCGLHCAPSAHKTLGTFPQGTVRFSWPLHSEADIEGSHCSSQGVELESTRINSLNAVAMGFNTLLRWLIVKILL